MFSALSLVFLFLVLFRWAFVCFVLVWLFIIWPFGKRAAHTHPIFLGVPLPLGVGGGGGGGLKLAWTDFSLRSLINNTCHDSCTCLISSNIREIEKNNNPVRLKTRLIRTVSSSIFQIGRTSDFNFINLF